MRSAKSEPHEPAQTPAIGSGAELQLIEQGIQLPKQACRRPIIEQGEIGHRDGTALLELFDFLHIALSRLGWA